LRYHPLYHFAKAHYVDKGLLGKVNNIHCQWNRNGTWRREHPKYAPGDYKKWGYETPDEVFNWRLYRKFSCGLMTELASHQLDIINWFFGDKLPTVIHGVGRIDNDDSKLGPYPKRTIFDNVHLIYEFPDNIQMSYQSITTNAFSPFGEAYEMIQGERATLVMAHLSSYVGLYFLEPGASQELWMAAAQRGKFDSPNARKDYNNPILLNGQPSPGSRLEKVGGIDLVELVDTTTCQLRPGWTTYQIELYSFKQCVLDKQAPYCDGFVGIKSAVPALLGYEALEKQQPLTVDPNLVKP